MKKIDYKILFEVLNNGLKDIEQFLAIVEKKIL